MVLVVVLVVVIRFLISICMMCVVMTVGSHFCFSPIGREEMDGWGFLLLLRLRLLLGRLGHRVFDRRPIHVFWFRLERCV